jgi:predicted metal-dependent peptidase
MYNNWTPHEKLVKARIDFIHQDCVFLGNLSLRLKLIEALWIPTAATDGFHFYYNPHFIERLDLDECKFVVAHEVMHCVYEHILRRGGRDARLFNIAGDYVINYELKEMGVGKFISQEKMSDPELLKLWKEKAKKEYDKWMKESAGEPGILYDPRFKGMSTEEAYDILFQEEQESGEQQQGGFDSHMDAGEGEGDGQEADDCETCGGTGIDPNDDGEGDEQDGDGHGHGGKPCPDCGGTGKDNSGKTGRIQVSKEDLDRLPDDMKKAVMDAAAVAEASDTAGRIPAGVKRLINEWTDSKMDWREYLNNIIQSLFKSDYTWQRQSRKSMSAGFYLPGMDNDDMVSVDIAIDTSGSMSDKMLKDILGEVRGIMEQFQDFKMRVWCFDTEAYEVHEYTQENVDEIDEFELVGFGGTDFMCNWEMMRDKEIVPDQLILCTDGYPCGSWGEEDYCETVFLIHGEGKKASVVAPFGDSVYYEEAIQE